MDLKITNISEDPIVRGIFKDKDFPEFLNEYVVVGEDIVLAKYYEEFAKGINEFKIRDDDTLICTFPKVGTTWTQEMVWLIGNNLNYESAKMTLHMRSPVLEGCLHQRLSSIQKVFPGSYDVLGMVNDLPSPRFLKIHLPFNLLPEVIRSHSKKPKIVYVLRNPKDVCVSYYHHLKAVNEWNVDFNSFCELFLAGRVDYGSYMKHLLSYWEKRNDFSIFFVVYEEMKKDLATVVKRVAHFLEKDLPEEAIAPLCDHLSFDSMKKNESIGLEDIVSAKKEMKLAPENAAFFRSGVSGKFKEEMPPEIIKKFDEWTKSHIGGTEFEKKFGDYMY